MPSKCSKCGEPIRPPREPVRGAFGYDVLCPLCFGRLKESLAQRETADTGKPTSLKQWSDDS